MQDYIPRIKDINGKIESITVKQFDNNSRFLHVKILDDDVDGKLFDLTDCTASLYIQPKDNTDPSKVAYITGEASFDEENGGIATFLLPGSVTQNVGDYECEIHINEGDTENYPHISTKPFIMTVEKSIRNDAAIMASAQFSALDRWASDVQNIKSEVAALIASPAGSGGDTGTELRDIRTGWDGATYNTAGDAVRNQINTLHGLALTGANTIINSDNFSNSPFSGSFDNIPNNKIYPINLLNVGNNANPPSTNVWGQLITLGKNTSRNSGDTQIYIPEGGGVVWIRQYSSSGWNTWKTTNQRLESEINTEINRIKGKLLIPAGDKTYLTQLAIVSGKPVLIYEEDE